MQSHINLIHTLCIGEVIGGQQNIDLNLGK